VSYSTAILLWLGANSRLLPAPRGGRRCVGSVRYGVPDQEFWSALVRVDHACTFRAISSHPTLVDQQPHVRPPALPRKGSMKNHVRSRSRSNRYWYRGLGQVGRARKSFRIVAKSAMGKMVLTV
jgi:hypothetical protein